MGLLFLQSRQSKQEDIVRNTKEKIYFKWEQEKRITFMQVLSVSFLKYHLNSAFVYVRKTPTQEEVLRVQNFLSDVDLVMGDLNLDKYRNEDAVKINLFCKTRSQILNEVTTTWFNQLDHVLLDCSLFPSYFTTSFRNHTTDHHTIVLRLPLFGNTMATSFLETVNFDGEHWTKTTKRKATNEEGKEKKFRKQSTEVVENAKDTLKSLLSPNWLTSEIVNSYIQLLRKLDSTVIIFDTAFYHKVKQCGYDADEMDMYDSLGNFKKLFIPIFEEDHCFLITYEICVVII